MTKKFKNTKTGQVYKQIDWNDETLDGDFQVITSEALANIRYSSYSVEVVAYLSEVEEVFEVEIEGKTYYLTSKELELAKNLQK